MYLFHSETQTHSSSAELSPSLVLQPIHQLHNQLHRVIHKITNRPLEYNVTFSKSAIPDTKRRQIMDNTRSCTFCAKTHFRTMCIYHFHNFLSQIFCASFFLWWEKIAVFFLQKESYSLICFSNAEDCCQQKLLEIISLQRWLKDGNSIIATYLYMYVYLLKLDRASDLLVQHWLSPLDFLPNVNTGQRRA